MGKFLRLAVAVAMAAWISGAGATQTIWKLDGITFSDGGIATGWFALDDSAPGLIADYEIQTPTIADFTGVSYTLDNNEGPIGNIVRQNATYYTSPGGFLALTFAAPILNANSTVRAAALGTTIPLNLGSIDNYEILFTSLAGRNIVAGSIVAVVPEPQSAALIVAGLALVGMIAAHRRQRSNDAATGPGAPIG